MAIIKSINHPTQGFPLSFHILASYSVYKSAGVVVANLNSHFNESTAQGGYQPSLKVAVQIVGVPEGDVEEWIYGQLVAADDGSIQKVSVMDVTKYPWASGYTPQDRFYFSGGALSDTEVIE